jgi:putative peptidoglycan lipid II flippase
MKEKAIQLYNRLNGRQTMGAAAAVISTSYLASRLLGLLRDRLLVSHFGKGPVLDAYNAAFRLPDLLFTLLVSGAFAVAFIPVFTEYLEKNERARAWRVTASLLNLLVLGTAITGVAAAVFADPLITLLTPGFDPARHQMTVELTRIMLVTPVLFAVSSVLGSVQQAYNRFLIYSISGVLYNLGIIAGIIWLAPRFSIYGVAWGVVAGVVVQAASQLIGLRALGFRYKPELGLKLAGVRQTIKLMVPRSLDQGIDQINYVVETIIGSLLAKGSITALTLSNNLRNVPLVLIASSISTAAFPRLAASAAKGERTNLIERYVTTARLILFLAIPSALFAIVARGYIVRLLYGFGDVDTANTLGWFAGTIVFAGLSMLVSRVFYARQDTKTPFIMSMITIPINIVVGYLLSMKYGVSGLAMSASLVSALEVAILMAILRHREGNFGELAILRGAWRMLFAGGVMFLALYLTIRWFLPLYAADKGFLTLLPKFIIITFIGAVTYVLPCLLMRVREAKVFWLRLRDTMLRSRTLT